MTEQELKTSLYLLGYKDTPKLRQHVWAYYKPPITVHCFAIHRTFTIFNGYIEYSARTPDKVMEILHKLEEV